MCVCVGVSERSRAREIERRGRVGVGERERESERERERERVQFIPKCILLPEKFQNKLEQDERCIVFTRMFLMGISSI